MPYSPITYTITSGQVSTPEFNYAAITLSDSDTINHLDQLKVSLNGTVLTPTTDYTLDEPTTTMTVSATIAVDDILLIERDTDVDDPRVTYVNNALIDKDNLNASYEQILFRLQELNSEIGNAITLDLSLNCWDGLGYPACNFAPATTSSGLVTLAQVQSLIAGVDIATSDDVNKIMLSGDGSTTVFGLPGFPTTDLRDEVLQVTLSGVMQVPTTDYTFTLVGSTPTLTFTSAPPTGTNNILVRAFKGTIQASYADTTIDGDALITGSVPVTALEAAAGVADRFITFNASGVGSIGTIDHTQISDFDAGVQANRLDQMALPTTTVNFNGQTLTGVPTPTSGGHGANKSYVDAAVLAASSVSGSNRFMEPYDTDSSAKFTSSLTSQTVSGLTAGTYFVEVHTDGASGTATVTCGGVTREAVGTGPSVSFITSIGGTSLSVTSSNCNIRNITGFRLA